MPAMNAEVWSPASPMRIVPASAVKPALPISMLWLPAAIDPPASYPRLMLLLPVVLLFSVSVPMAVL
jgi:hypothetical protein